MRVEPGIEEIQYVRRRLLAWWRRQAFDYPWRSTENPWHGLVAEILLQRTRAAQVVPVYEWFAQRYQTPEAFLRDRAGARKVTKTLGLHDRARHLRAAAEAIVVKGFPADIAELRRIRGIGMYTAAAWLTFHRGRRAVVIDANIFRWLGRMTGRAYHRDPRNVTWLYRCADALTPPLAFRAYNYALLDFTMTICTPRQPRCDECVLWSLCVFGRQA